MDNASVQISASTLFILGAFMGALLGRLVTFSIMSFAFLIMIMVK
jgi:hypothetical protein